MSTINVIEKQVALALQELLPVANLKKGSILVVGCSTSEISGHQIGSQSSMEIASAVMEGLLPTLTKAGIYLAVQSCEHLNRVLVLEEACLDKYQQLEEVLVVPHQDAGGSLATVAMSRMSSPVIVEKIQAHAGMDIGDTFIGMHLKRVVVPVRSSIKQIGEAHLSMARTRPPLVGGERAYYK